MSSGIWVTQYLCLGHAEEFARTTTKSVRMIPESWHVQALLDAQAKESWAEAHDQLAWTMP